MLTAVSQLYRYPVKGLSAEELESVDVTAREGLPGDRRFAMALGSTPVDKAASEWLAKTHFLMLMRNEKLAQLQTTFDAQTGVLTVLRRGRQVARGDLTTAIGRTVIEDFFSAFMGEAARGGPKIVAARENHMLSDHAEPVLSMINLASLRDIERVVQRPVDPVRFRANVYFDTGTPWQEFDWVERKLRIGGAEFYVKERIDRCAATNVNPETAERDLNIPKALMMAFGHIDCGIFARVTGGGRISVGDEIEVFDA